MSKTLQFKRYPTSTLSSTTGANGEIIVDTTLKTLTVHDGVMPGGSTLVSNNNSANLAQIGITGNIWDVGHIVVGDVITSANINNVVNFNSNQTQTSFAKTLNIVDANAGFKVIRTNGNPSIELSQWDNTLSTEISTYDLQINNNIFQLRSKQLNYTGTLTNNVVVQFTANTGTGTQSVSPTTGAMIVRGGVGVNGNLNASNTIYANTGIGYPTGTGNTVTQTTSRTSTVFVNTPTGQITLFNQAMAPQTSNTFIIGNSFIGANDFILLNHFSGGTLGGYHLAANTSTGQANVTIRNVTTSTLTEAPVIQYVVIKAAAT